MLDRLYGAVRGLDVPEDVRAAAEPPEALVAALEDDINTPKAMAEFFALAKDLNKASDADEKILLAASMFAAGDLMGLLQSDPEEWFSGHVEGDLSADDIEALIEKRNAARKDKDFAAADAVRDQLAAANIKIEDGAGGTTWRRDD
jgi:cysteinyl-tRNA synthetase